MKKVLLFLLLSLHASAKSVPSDVKAFLEAMTQGQTDLFDSDEGRPLEIRLIANYTVIESRPDKVSVQYSVVGLLLWDDLEQRYSHVRFSKAKLEKVTYPIRYLNPGRTEILAPLHSYPYVKQELIHIYFKGRS